MPELPEVETVRRGLEPALTGAVLTRVEQRRADLRFPFPENFAARLTGRRVTAIGRRAKYLLADLDDGNVLLMHLGMSGSFRVDDRAKPPHAPGSFHHPRSARALHDHVVFHTDRGTVTYNDPRRFGFMLLVPRATLHEHKLMRGIGVEPLGNELDGELLARAFAGKKTSLKAALLDQRLIAGLGNIYVCEALHRARLSPRRAAKTLAGRGKAQARAAILALSIRDVLTDAIAAGGSSLRDHSRTDGELGDFQHHFRAYDRAGTACPNAGCNGTIGRIVQGGRSTYFCPVCQR